VLSYIFPGHHDLIYTAKCSYEKQCNNDFNLTFRIFNNIEAGTINRQFCTYRKEWIQFRKINIYNVMKNQFSENKYFEFNKNTMQSQVLFFMQLHKKSTICIGSNKSVSSHNIHIFYILLSVERGQIRIFKMPSTGIIEFCISGFKSQTCLKWMVSEY